MKKEDFMFTIGFIGKAAIIDAPAKKKYSKLSVDDLLDKGLYKAAFCSAMYDNDDAGLQKVLVSVNSSQERTYDSVSQLKRLFGVFSVPENIDKTIDIKQ